MTTQFWKAALMSPAFVGVVLAGAGVAAEAPSLESSLELSAEPIELALETAEPIELALEPVEAEAIAAPIAPVAAEPVQLAQVASVTELSDVSPTDWAYSALQNLVETYGCIEGYPNRTFRGNQALTRYEFAAGLNACLDVLATLITGEGLDEGTLATIQRLQQEFQAELATLRGRVDALEAETAQLRAQQFSTTTRLRGQVDAHLVAPFGDLGPAGAQVDNNTAFVSRARLNFDTSFTGSDLLRTRLQYGDGTAPLLAAGGLFSASNTGGNVVVDDFFYQFPIGSRVTAIIAANSIVQDDFVASTIVPWDGVGVAGASTPGLYGFDMGGGGFGAGLSFQLTDSIIFDAGYTGARVATTNPNPGGTAGAGIFGANAYSFTTQLSFLPEGFFNGALVYQRGNSNANSTWGELAGSPANLAPTDTYGALASLDFGALILAGAFGIHDTVGTSTNSWQVGVAFPDLFMEGGQLGIYYSSLPSYNSRPDMLEGYYSIPVNQFLTITPSLVYGNINRDSDLNTSNFYGVIRTTFRF